MNYRKLIKIVQAQTDTSMKDLAKHLNVRTATIYARIDRNNPSYDELKELADFAGVDVDQLIKWGE